MVTFMLPVAALAADDVATVKNGTTITKNTTQEELDQWAGAGAVSYTHLDVYKRQVYVCTD